MAHERNRFVGPYLRLCRPDGVEWAAYLRRWGGFHAMGEECSIQTNVVFTDPAYARLGNNVRLSGCILFGHDGSVNMLNRAYGLKLDRVGKIDLRDHVFIGHGAIVLPGVTIGPRALVAAGAVVTRDVPENSVVAGIPAKVVCTLDEHVERLQRENESYPWREHILQREGDFDTRYAGLIEEARKRHFFG